MQLEVCVAHLETKKSEKEERSSQDDRKIEWIALLARPINICPYAGPIDQHFFFFFCLFRGHLLPPAIDWLALALGHFLLLFISTHALWHLEIRTSLATVDAAKRKALINAEQSYYIAPISHFGICGCSRPTAPGFPIFRFRFGLRRGKQRIKPPLTQLVFKADLRRN